MIPNGMRCCRVVPHATCTLRNRVSLSLSFSNDKRERPSMRGRISCVTTNCSLYAGYLRVLYRASSFRQWRNRWRLNGLAMSRFWNCTSYLYIYFDNSLADSSKSLLLLLFSSCLLKVRQFYYAAKWFEFSWSIKFVRFLFYRSISIRDAVGDARIRFAVSQARLITSAATGGDPFFAEMLII